MIPSEQQRLMLPLLQSILQGRMKTLTHPEAGQSKKLKSQQMLLEMSRQTLCLD
jgi:hypothetical protein